MKSLIYFLIFIVLISVVVGDSHVGGGGAGPVYYTEDECQQRAYDICNEDVRIAKEQNREEQKESQMMIGMLLLGGVVLYFYFKKKKKPSEGYDSKSDELFDRYLGSKKEPKEEQPFTSLDTLFKKPKEETITKPKEPKSEKIDESLFYKEI